MEPRNHSGASARVLALAAGGLFGAFAFAPAAALAQSGMPDEIIVTAQKREQNLKEVPIAVTALQGAYLADRAITSVDNLNALAPGLVVSPTPTQPNNAQISIRGSVQQNGSIVLDPSVGLYLDGVYIGKAQGSIFDINDLERVEVLRGPQGTLYGRNTLAGAINFITSKPSDVYRGSLEAGYGNFNAVTLKGMVNIPITDKLFAKVSASSFTRDGVTKLVPDPIDIFGTPLGEIANGGIAPSPFGNEAKKGRLGSRDRQNFTGQLRYLATDDITLDYMFDYSQAKGIADSSQLQSVDPNGFLGANCAFGSACVPAYLYLQPEYSDTAFNDVKSRDKAFVRGHGLVASWDLGNVTLKSTSGYRTMSYKGYPSELDGTPLMLATAGLITDYKAFSQEFQAAGTIGDRLNYVAGVYYFKDEGLTINPQHFFFGAVNYYTRYGSDTEAYAVYGQADYKVTDRLTLTAGLRYTQEEKTIERLSVLLPSTVLVNVTKAEGVKEDFDALNPTAIVSYKVTDDLNVYGKFAQGYRSGGFNGEAGSRLAVTTPFDPEKINSLEAGLKSSWFDRRLDVNVAAFLNKRKDMQLSVFTATSTLESLIQNAGSAKMQGVEIESVIKPTNNLRINANFAYLDAKYEKFIDTNGLGQAIDVADNRVIPHAPEFQVTVGADYLAYKGDAGDSVRLLVDTRYSSSYYLYAYAKTPDFAAFPLVPGADSVKAQAVFMVDAQVRWEDISVGSSNLWVSLWGKNLTDIERKTNGINFGPSFGGLNIANYNDPRTYGVSIGAKW